MLIQYSRTTAGLPWLRECNKDFIYRYWSLFNELV